MTLDCLVQQLYRSRSKRETNLLYSICTTDWKSLISDQITEKLLFQLIYISTLETKVSAAMSSTSQKHKNFVSEPMGDKSVNELAGIGEVLSKRLEAKGFDKAFVVLGQFLVLKKHKELFIDWMKDICQANSKQASECYQCISDWCDEFL
ncbi:Barrier-to-autointegration factor [Araneus ventricosus]|uniref:Barrier-to-autointegration factor-like protein n=1 Tax=Araneus ventricosus TaxID=182803 RepID=A0A4Y2EX65_ARAVE|nr:Barrier-to-autointegration factor [Araneus ventricosus]